MTRNELRGVFTIIPTFVSRPVTHQLCKPSKGTCRLKVKDLQTIQLQVVHMHPTIHKRIRSNRPFLRQLGRVCQVKAAPVIMTLVPKAKRWDKGLFGTAMIQTKLHAQETNPQSS